MADIKSILENAARRVAEDALKTEIMLNGKMTTIKDALEQVPIWIPCSKRMPEEHSTFPCVFLVWNDLIPRDGEYTGYPHLGFYNWNFKAWQDDNGNLYFDTDGYVTHWFPCPSIPSFPNGGAKK